MHFTKCALLMQDLLAAKRDLRLSREIKRLGRYDGLIIDDLGYLQQSQDDMEVVFTLLAERYERGSGGYKLNCVNGHRKDHTKETRWLLTSNSSTSCWRTTKR